jgi:rhodanese-related sulfurtransferase
MKARFVAMVVALLPAAAFAFGQAGVNYEEPAALERLIEGRGKPPYILVDVRTPEEYAFGHIPTAVNIPVSEIASRPPTEDRSALIVVYCRSGSRSGTAQRTLREMGYGNVVNFGPVSKWEKPLVTGDSPLGQ